MSHLTKTVTAISVLITKMIRRATFGVGPDERNVGLVCIVVSIVTGGDGTTVVFMAGLTNCR